MAQEHIDIIVREKGTREVQRRLGDIGGTASASAQGVNLLRTALTAIGGTLVVRQLIRTADEFVTLTNRVRIATDGIGDINDTLNRLQSISRETRSPLSANISLFQRASLAAKELGASQEELFQLTENVGRALAIQGGSAAESSGALLQLSQALGAGTVRAEEFNSILEGAFPIAQAAARGYEEAGGSVAKLRSLVIKGQVSSEDFFRALLSQTNALRKQFGNTVGNVSQGLTVLRDAWTVFTGRLLTSSGVVTGLSNLLQYLADNIELVGRLVGAAGLTASLFLAISALKTLTALVLANPLGLIAVGATLAVSSLITFSDQITVSKDSVVTLADFASASFERIKSGIGTMVGFVKSEFPSLGEAIDNTFGDLDISLEGFIKGAARVLDRYIGFWRATINAIVELFKGLGPALKEIMIDIVNDIITTIDSGLREFYNLLGRIPGRIGQPYRRLAEEGVIPRLEQTAVGATDKLKNSIVEGFAKGFDEVTVFEDSVNSLFDRAEEIAKDRLAEEAKKVAGPVTATAGDNAPISQGQSTAFTKELEEIRKQGDILRLTNEQRQIQNQLIKEEVKLKSQGVQVTEGQREQLTTELQRLQLISQTSQALDQVRGIEIDLSAAQAELNEQVKAGNITLEEAVQAYALLQDQALATSTTVEAGFQRGLNDIGRTINDFATHTENTLVNAFQNSEDALVDFVRTGELDFSSMVDSMLEDLTRLMIKMLAAIALNALLPGSGTAFMNFSGGMAGGGDVLAGSTYVVGEDGPELFTPTTPGQIISNDRIAKAVGSEESASSEPAVVNVIVVDSMEKALAAMESTEGQRIMVRTWNEQNK